MKDINNIEELLPLYFESNLTDEDRQKVETWKNRNEKNHQVFVDSQKAWEQLELLRSMQKYNAGKARKQVRQKIEKHSRERYIQNFQRIAAILILPLFIATIYFALNKTNHASSETEWYTVKTPPGSRSEFVLPDGSKVYLNSNSILKYPLVFNAFTRDVELKGEAYFEVTGNKNHPFIVNTGKIKIEVTGTEFKASNYPAEELTEIILVEGNIRLFQGDFWGEKDIIKAMVPGEKATYIDAERKLYYELVDTEKYTSWKDGVLMFRDDSMKEVVRRLNRWFNVNIQLRGNELGDYVYTATFEDESLMQILDLLKISAPIEYKIRNREKRLDNTFSKMEIEIIQK